MFTSICPLGNQQRAVNVRVPKTHAQRDAPFKIDTKMRVPSFLLIYVLVFCQLVSAKFESFDLKTCDGRTPLLAGYDDKIRCVELFGKSGNDAKLWINKMQVEKNSEHVNFVLGVQKHPQIIVLHEDSEEKEVILDKLFKIFFALYSDYFTCEEINIDPESLVDAPTNRYYICTTQKYVYL